MERLIPVRQTNFFSSAPVVFASPLDLSSLQTLTETFARILAQVERKREYESSGTDRTIEGNDLPSSSVGDIDNQPTSDLPTSHRQPLRGNPLDLAAGGER